MSASWLGFARRCEHDSTMRNLTRLLCVLGLLLSVAFAQSVDETRKKAEKGDADAQYNLGVMYQIGEGVPKDSAEAVKWYRLAADQGLARAQTNLGWMYKIGDGVPKDSPEAMKWYRLAADQGNAKAQYDLGVMYANGKGVPKDLVQAHVWWNIAGASGNEQAKKDLTIVEKEMTDTQKEKAMKLARELFAKLPKTK